MPGKARRRPLHALTIMGTSSGNSSRVALGKFVCPCKIRIQHHQFNLLSTVLIRTERLMIWRGTPSRVPYGEPVRSQNVTSRNTGIHVNDFCFYLPVGLLE